VQFVRSETGFFGRSIRAWEAKLHLSESDKITGFSRRQVVEQHAKKDPSKQKSVLPGLHRGV